MCDRDVLFQCLTHVVAGSDSEMLPWLLSEFPFLYLSPETVHDLWHKGSRQLELLSRASTEVKRKKSKAQVEVFTLTELLPVDVLAETKQIYCY